jgi:peptide/nickel transport system substrate-binding protein
LKKSRLGAVIAVATAGALALAGCTSTGGSGASASAKPTGGTVSVAIVNDLTSLNNNTPQGNLDTNGIYAYLAGAQFSYPDQNFNLKSDTDIGTFTKVSNDPLTVKYTLNKDLKWSDGQPMTADDLVLNWAINSGYYDDATLDADGNVTKGTQYFAIAGSTAGLDQTSFPTVGDNNRSITLTFAKPYVDWNLLFSGTSAIAQPAHIVAKEAGLSSAAALTSLLKGLPHGNPAAPAAPNTQLLAAAKFVNTGYDITSFPSNKDLTVSGGPWMISNWTPGQSVEFVHNPEYKGALAPKIDKLVLRVIPDSAAQVTALQNGEVDIAYPQASADTKKSFESISGAKVLTGNQVSYDHLDLNFGAPVFKDPKVRQAFLLTIPRDQIVDAIVKPINPAAKPLNSQIWLPNQVPYATSVAQNGSDAYSKVDIAKAKSLLAGATPTVKILYNTKNPNRVDEFQAIQASAAQAGFKVVDGGDPKWSTLLSAGNYDASIFGWISPGVGTAQIPQLFASASSGNYNKFTAANDQALATQTTLDPKKLNSLMMEIDKIAFSEGYGLPLFQAAGVWGVSNKVDGVVYMGNQTGPVWNNWEWSVKTSTSSK